MRLFLIAAAAFMALAAQGACAEAQAASLPPPLEPASQGRLQCFLPDAGAKTCQSLASYAPRPDGDIDNTVVILIAKDPAVVMTTHSVVKVKDDQVCGVMRRDDIEGASFTVAGQPAAPDQADHFRDSLRQALANMIGRRICTAYLPVSDGLIAKATVEGLTQPAPDQKVIWVSPDDGYSVSP